MARSAGLLLALAALLLTLGLAGPAQAEDCEASCVQALRSRGAPAWDVKRLCCTKASSSAATGQRCVGMKATCIMLRSAPLGSSCYCATPAGLVPGHIRQ